MLVGDLPTPALVVDLATLNHNVDEMAKVRPAEALRAHVKAHKCTGLAAHAARRSGSSSFCCATLREAEGLIRAGLGADVLIANETLDERALASLVRFAAARDAVLTIAVDSPETVEVAATARRFGPIDVLVDVDVGMPRCGIAPDRAGWLADLARRSGLEVRGVMGYEGHAVANPDRAARAAQVAESMEKLARAHEDVGGGLTSAGGTGTFDLHDWVDEVQAGSYLLMDTAYASLDLPFRHAVTVLATVISVNVEGGWAVADAGLKAFGMDHGNPTPVGHGMFFCSDEHTTFLPGPERPVRVGDRIELLPAHIDPTMALHERVHVVERRRTDGTVSLDAEVLETWPIDLRGW